MNLSFFQKTKNFARTHKKTSIAITIGLIIVAYFIFKPSNTSAETKYVVGNVEVGTIVSSISGSGQVEATNQIDLKAKASGTITYVGVKAGDTVKKGKTLFSLDSRDAARAVRNAQTDLETAQLDLEKFKQAPDSVDVLAIKKSIADAEQSKVDAQNNVKKAYRNLLNSSTVAYSVDPGNTQTAPTISGTYTKDIEATITIEARGSGGNSWFTFSTDPAGLINNNSYNSLSTVLPQPIGDSGLYIKFASANNQPNWTISLPNKTTSAYNSNLQSYQDALDNQKKTNASADLTIAQNTRSLNELYTPDSFDLRAKELVVQQRQDSLLTAKENLSDYYISAPFDGVIASVLGKVGDTASGTLATIITNQKIATISLNEVDVSKIKIGQKATITFDAIEDLTITGTVVEIDALGTTNQGVVSYSVKIAFDTDDEQIKPGMTTSANIITDSKQDVLIVPSSAVKSSTTGSYVEMFDTPLVETSASAQGTVSITIPNKIPVQIGISSDTSVEIISGIEGGDQIVTRTIAGTSTKTTTSAPSLIGGNTGGGATRALGR